MNNKWISVDRELLENLLDNSLELQCEWSWKNNSSKSNNREMQELKEDIEKATNLLSVEPNEMIEESKESDNNEIWEYLLSEINDFVGDSLTQNDVSKDRLIQQLKTNFTLIKK